MNTKATKTRWFGVQNIGGKVSACFTRVCALNLLRARALRIFLMLNFAQIFVYNILIPKRQRQSKKIATAQFDTNAEVMCSILAVCIFNFWMSLLNVIVLPLRHFWPKML